MINLSKKNLEQLGGGVGKILVLALKFGVRDDVGTLEDRPFPLFHDLYMPLPLGKIKSKRRINLKF